MPITYTIDQEEKLITEVWSGEIDMETLALYWRQYLQNPEVLEIRRTLVDLRQAAILFSGEQLRSLVRTIVLPMLDGRDWKTAIVVEEPHQFGVSRQYHVFAESYSEDAIFYNMEDARRWLLGSPD